MTVDGYHQMQEEFVPEGLGSPPEGWSLFGLVLSAYILSLGVFGWSREYLWLSKGFGYAAAVLFLIRLITGAATVNSVMVWWTGFTGWMAIGAFTVAEHFAITIGEVYSMIQITVLTAMVASFSTSVRRGAIVAWLVALTSLFPFLGRLTGLMDPNQLQYDEGVTTATMEKAGRFTGTIGQPNAFAAIMVFGAMCATIAFVTSGRRGKLIALAVLALQFAGTLASGSRGGFLMFVFLIIATYGVHYLRNIGRRFLGAVAVLAAIALVGYFLLPIIADSEVGRRLGQTFGFLSGGSRGGSGRERIAILVESLRIFISSPIMGVGMSMFRWVSGTGMYPHNNFAVILTGTGIVGALIYFAPIVGAFKRLFRIVANSDIYVPDRPFYAQLFAVLVTSLAYGMFMGTWKHKLTTCILGIVFGSAAAISKRTKELSISHSTEYHSDYIPTAQIR